MVSASDWARGNVTGRFRDELLIAFGLLVFAGAAAFVTTFAVFGFLLMFGVVMAGLGIRPPHPVLIAPVAVTLQVVVFYLVKPSEIPLVTVERTEDTGELIIVRTDRAHGGYFDGGPGSLGRIVKNVLLCTGIALYEVVRHIRAALQVKRTNPEHVAYLASYLSDRGAKATLAEIERDLHSINLQELLPQIDRLPGFNLIMSHPQGVALTDGALEEMGQQVY